MDSYWIFFALQNILYCKRKLYICMGWMKNGVKSKLLTGPCLMQGTDVSPFGLLQCSQYKLRTKNTWILLWILLASGILHWRCSIFHSTYIYIYKYIHTYQWIVLITNNIYISICIYRYIVNTTQVDKWIVLLAHTDWLVQRWLDKYNLTLSIKQHGKL